MSTEPVWAYDGACFDPLIDPDGCPEVQRWPGAPAEPTASWGYVLDPMDQSPVRQLVHRGDWVVHFADGHIRVMTAIAFHEMQFPAGGLYVSVASP